MRAGQRQEQETMTTIEPTNYLNTLAANAEAPGLSQAELSLVGESLT